jgi:carboxyl-terminal processing protease
MKHKRLLLWTLIPVSGILLALRTDYFEVSKQLDIFVSLYRDINQYYVDEVPPRKTMERAIGGMLEGLDPYTTYIAEDQIEDYRIAVTGQYGGIGMEVRQKGDNIIIEYIAEGFPAQKAGLLPGDALLSVNGKPVATKTVDQVAELTKGNPGTEVSLEVVRAGKTIKHKLKRERITTKAVTYSGFLSNTKTGYIYLSSFLPECSKEVRKAIESLQAQGMEHLVLDLRGNPGGLLEEAVEVTNLFVPAGVKVVSTQGKDPSKNQVFSTRSEPIAPALPLVVLINRGSASASEIVAGTLQDLDRAVLIGQRSFGKGLVQETRPLPYGASLKVTIAKYYTYSGRCIQAINYAERNPDGSVSRIPDSLRTAFTTRGGRTVYDGGGIDPDIALEERQYSDVLFALGQADAFFDFANQYRLKNPQTPALESFVVTDQVFSEFSKFASSAKVEYRTTTEELLQELQAAAKEDRYANELPSLKQLNKEFEQAKAGDIQRNAAELKQFLGEEIMGRYHFDRGRLAYGLRDDQETERALQLLTSGEYRQILSPRQ